MVVHTLNLSTRKTGRWIFEFKTRVVYRVSSTTAKTTQKKPVLRNQRGWD